ncbi:hypothetical protein HispidOSU_028558, partial [Sigmodon hispidus]
MEQASTEAGLGSGQCNDKDAFPVFDLWCCDSLISLSQQENAMHSQWTEEE